MKLRMPLYARILGLFLLNILLIFAAFVVVFQVQFQLGADSFLASQANRRVQAVSRAVIGELQQAPERELEAVLDRFAEALGLDLYIFGADGTQLGGQTVSLPLEVEQAVRHHITRWVRRGGGGWGAGNPPGARPGQPPPQAGQVPEPETPGVGPVPAEQRRPGPPPSFFLKSRTPTRYWAGTVFPARIGRPGLPPRVLLMASDSVTGGGLFFDLKPWLMAGMGGLVLSALIWLPFVRSMTRSVSQMMHATEQISMGRFDVRTNAWRGDELGQLAAAINDMAGRLQGFVTGQRRFLGDIAHELCSPLARIQTALGVLEQRAGARVQPYVKDLRNEAEHMSQLVAELLSFSRTTLNRSKPSLESTVLAEVVARAVQRERVDGVTIEVDVAPALVAQAHSELLQRAIANLLRNAVRCAGQAGSITVAAWQEEAEVVVEVADQGPGVPPEALPKLFDPFYRVDESRTRDTGGVGLGLTIVKTCVESCQGRVTARNRPEGGLSVEIRLRSGPAAPE